MADGFQLRAKIFLRDGAVKAGHRPGPLIRKRRNDFPQVIWSDANVAVAEDQNFVLRFLRQTRQIVHLAVRPQMLCPHEEANAPLRKMGD